MYGHDDVSERDLPHWTKLIELVFKAYEDEHRKLLDGFKVSELIGLRETAGQEFATCH